MKMTNWTAPALALLALLLASSPSRAAFEIQVSVDGGSFFSVASGSDFTTIQFTGRVSSTGINATGPIRLTVSSSTSDNNADVSDLLSSTNKVETLTSGQHTVVIMTSQTNYTLPASSKLMVESSLGGNVTKGTLGRTNIFQGYADAGNGLFGTSDFTTGSQTASAGGAFNTGSADGVFDRGGSYSLTSKTTLVLNGTLVSGTAAVVNYSNQINVTAVPVPASLVLLASGSIPAMARLAASPEG